VLRRYGASHQNDVELRHVKNMQAARIRNFVLGHHNREELVGFALALQPRRWT